MGKKMVVVGGTQPLFPPSVQVLLNHKMNDGQTLLNIGKSAQRPGKQRRLAILVREHGEAS